MLITKNIDSCPPYSASLEFYARQSPEMVSVDITEDTVTEIAVHLSRGNRLGGDVIHETVTLAPEVPVSNHGVAADWGGLRGVASEQETPLDRLPVSAECKIDCTGQADRGQASQGERNLAPTHGEVRLAGDRSRIQ